MKKFTKEVKLGLIIVVTVIVFIYGLYYLKGVDLLKTRRYYYAIYDELHGLTVDNMVIVKGVPIGKIVDISLTNTEPQKVVVKFLIQDKNVKIYKSTIGKIVSTDILGTRAIELETFNPIEVANPGDTIKTAVQKDIRDVLTEQLKPLKTKFEETFSSLDSIIRGFQAITGKGAQEDIALSISYLRGSLFHIERATASLDTLFYNKIRSIEEIIANLNEILRTLKEHKDAIAQSLQNIKKLSDTLSNIKWGTLGQKTDTLLTNLNYITWAIRNQQGSLGKFVYDTMLYTKLTQSVSSLDSLLKDLQANPKRYVSFSLIGRKDKSQRNKEK